MKITDKQGNWFNINTDKIKKSFGSIYTIQCYIENHCLVYESKSVCYVALTLSMMTADSL